MLFETKSALSRHATIHPTLERAAPAARAGRGAWTSLLNQVMRLGDDRGELVSHAERPWASATFSGTRHTIVLTFDGAQGVAAGEALIAALPDHEFDIPRQVVADACIRAVDHTVLPDEQLDVTLELLLLQDI